MASEFTGRILHVNLTTGPSRSRPRPSRSTGRTSAGPRWGSTTSCATCPPGTDGLDPANVLTMMDSLLTGAPIAGQSRITINARSPLTDGIGDSQGGGFFPAELRFAGFTGIVIRGRAPSPSTCGSTTARPSCGRRATCGARRRPETVDTIKAELGDQRIEVAAIGPAGEKLVRLAAIISMGNRANGRTGMGAVMGSKNLKAVAVRGTTRKVADRRRRRVLGRLARWGSKEIPNNDDVIGLRNARDRERARGPARRRRPADLQLQRRPVRAATRRSSGETMTATILTERDTCYSCAVRCKRVVTTEWRGPARGAAARRPGVRDGGRRSAPTAAWTTSLPSRSPTRSATSTAWTRSARGDGRLDHGLLRARPAVRGGHRVPGPVRGRGRDGPPDRDDRDPGGHRGRPGQRLPPRRGPARQGPGVPDHGQGCRGARPHAPGEAVPGRHLRGQPVRRGPPVVRARRDDRGGRQRPLHGAAQAARLRRAAAVRLAGAGQGALRPQDPAVLLVPRHRHLCQFVWGPAWTLFGPQETVDAVQGRDRLGGLRRRRADRDRRAAAEHAPRVQRPRGHRPQGRPAAGQVLQAADRHRPHAGRGARPGGDRGRAGRVLPAGRLGRPRPATRRPRRWRAWGSPGSRRARPSDAPVLMRACRQYRPTS